MSTMSEAWFAEALRLDFGRSLMVQVLTKTEQREFMKDLEEERISYSLAEPIHASQLVISKLRKDNRYWVVIDRKKRAPLKGVIKNEDGSYSEIRIDPYRRRIITLMIRDGLSREEIEETLEGLTDEERKEFFDDNTEN